MRAKDIGKLDPDLAWKPIFKDPEWMFKVGVGGTLNAAALLLLFVNPLFVPVSIALNAVINGYLLRIVRHKMLNRESKLPDWNDFPELAISGLTWLAIQFSFWMILLSAITWILVLATASSVAFQQSTFWLWAIPWTILLSLVALSISFMNNYLMINFAIEEKLRAGFAVKKTFRRAERFPINFTLSWLLGIGVILASIIVPSLTLIGIFIVPSTFFLGQTIAVTLATQVWGKESD
jgi:hypothetical protein